MRTVKLYLQLILTFSVILLMASPSSSLPVDAYGGFISDSNINQGDSVVFSGTIHNFGDQALTIHSFNVSFIERLGETAARNPDRPNISRSYEGDRRTLGANRSLTDTMKETVDFDPGSYDVSIFFEFSAGSSSSVPTNTSYALINATMVIEGVTQALELARLVFYIIVALVIGVIGLIVYNAKFKKSY